MYTPGIHNDIAKVALDDPRPFKLCNNKILNAGDNKLRKKRSSESSEALSEGLEGSDLEIDMLLNFSSENEIYSGCTKLI